MKALFKTAVGVGNLELKDAPMPEIGDEDLLVKVQFCGVCGSDLHIEDGSHPCAPPVVIGHEFSGTVAGMGKDVRGFREGDPVAFLRGWNPYPGVSGDGGFAEYMRAPAACMWKTPEGVSQEAASQLETIITPMRLVKDEARVKPSDHVVVTGVGMIGLLTIAIATLEGGRVTAIGTERDLAVRLPIAAEMGADQTLVFSDETLEAVKEIGPATWIDASGAPAAIRAAGDLVCRNGTIVVAGLGSGPYELDIARMTYHNITMKCAWGGKTAYIRDAAELLRTRKLNIDSTLSVMPLDSWRTAFDMLKRQEGVKILLAP